MPPCAATWNGVEAFVRSSDYKKVLERLARWFNRHDVEDALQEVWMKRGPNEAAPDKKNLWKAALELLKGWRRNQSGKRRKNEIKTKLYGGWVESNGDSFEDSRASRTPSPTKEVIDRVYLEEILARIPELRRVIELRILEHPKLTIDEVAVRLKLTVSQVRYQEERGLAKLRNMMIREI